MQLDKLSKAGYVEITKTFKGKMPCTLCRITPQGVDAFEEYIEALKSYLVGNYDFLRIDGLMEMAVSD